MAGQTINVVSAPGASDANAAIYTIDATSVAQHNTSDPNYPDSFVFSDGLVRIDGFGVGTVTAFSYSNHELYLYGRGGLGGTELAIPFDDHSPAIPGQHLEVSRLGNTLYVTEGTVHMPAGATPLDGRADQPDPPAAQPTRPDQPTTPVVTNPPTTQPQPPDDITRFGHATIYDTTTQAYIGDHYSYPYMGPVAGLQYDCEPITPDSLNITARADSMFIKTSAGNDAIALQGGTNVVDAGGGSNFVTGASGFDTFYLDARSIPAASSAAGPVPGAIWDTIESFNAGDAATLFGIGPSAAFSWQRDGGAVGHTGLTLHAIKQNGTTASLTLAGIDNGSHLQLSFGSTGGANYLYVKAV